MSTQKQSFQSPEVRIVEASAGSGKTYALAKRYVQLLLDSTSFQNQVAIRHILAITFTNKAAFEMKARILDFLKRLALKKMSQQEEKEIISPLGIERNMASPKAYRIMDMIIHNYNFFQVQTIDSFINALLSGCAFKIGLSSNFQIKRNYRDFLAYGLDGMIERASHDPEIYKIFSDFLQQYLFLENKSGWFPKKDMLLLLQALYQQNNTYNYVFVPFPIKPEDLLKQKKIILKNLKELQKVLPSAVDARFLKSLDNFLQKYEQGFDFDRVSDYFARDTLPLRKGEKIPKDLHSLWKKIKKQLCQLAEAEAFSLFNPYIAVYHHVREEFYQLACKKDILFLEELNKKAQALFDDYSITVEELYYRLATRFHHYLLDEFQDTSILQWKNLNVMIEEALSTGGSLFYVGDKKQAIYGFRGGDARLFDYLKDQFFAFNVQSEFLGVNYRSQKAIVDFNNTIFSLENLKRFIQDKESFEIEKKKKDVVLLSEKDWEHLSKDFKTAQQKSLLPNNRGYVKVEYLYSKKKEDRYAVAQEKLLTLIKNLRMRFAFKDIAILTRGNKDVETLTSWLMEAGFPAESERTLNIMENAMIQELLALMQFLFSPINNRAFALFILGDVFTLATGLSKEQIQKFLFELNVSGKCKKENYIYREFRESYPEIWQLFFDEFFKNVGIYPLYEYMISLLNKFKVLENFSSQQGFIMRWLEVIKAQEIEGVDLGTFLDNIKNLPPEEFYVYSSKSDAIKILTIHKSKGLEFPVVIIPFLGMDIHVGTGGGLGQQSYILNFADESLELIRIKSKYLKYSEKLSKIWQQGYLQSLRSELNNIYVSLTRASKELYLFIPERIGSRNNIVKFLIPDEKCEWGRQENYPQTDLPLQSQHRLSISQYHDWIHFLRDEFLDHQQVVHRSQIKKGDICHKILSFIGNLDLQDLDKTLKVAVTCIKQMYPFEQDYSYYTSLVRKVITTAHLQSFFYTGDDLVFQETEMIDHFGNIKRIDRFIVKPKEVWIIDYKSSQDSALEFEQQVQDYMTLLHSVYPRKGIKGFLLYLDTCSVEEVFRQDCVK